MALRRWRDAADAPNGCFLTIMFVAIGLSIVGVISAIAVRRGASYVASHCVRPGTVAVYNSSAWLEYRRVYDSQSVREPGYFLNRRDAARSALGIISRTRRVRPSRFLLPTVSYPAIDLVQHGKVLATKSYYRADAYGPLSLTAFLGGGAGGFHCSDFVKYTELF